MSNEEKYEITVRFPEWEQEDFDDPSVKHKYPAFGVKYLFVTPIIPEPDWPDEDERWLSYDYSLAVEKAFLDWYKQKISREFNGEILFIESSKLVIARAEPTNA